MEQEAGCQLLGNWKGGELLRGKQKSVLWGNSAREHSDQTSSALTPTEVRGVTLQIDLSRNQFVVLSADELFSGLNKNQNETTTKEHSFLSRLRCFWDFNLNVPFLYFHPKLSVFWICFLCSLYLMANVLLNTLHCFVNHFNKLKESMLTPTCTCKHCLVCVCADISLLAFFAIFFYFLSSVIICMWILSAALFKKIFTNHI